MIKIASTIYFPCNYNSLYLMREHSVLTHVLLCRIGLSEYDEKTLGTHSCHVVPYRSVCI